MDNITTTLVLGAVGGINSGLVTAGAIEKLHLSTMLNTTVMIAIAGAIGGVLVVKAFRATMAILSDAELEPQLI